MCHSSKYNNAMTPYQTHIVTMAPRALFLSLLLGMAGCSSHPPRAASPPRAANPLPGKDACFWTRSLQDWTVLDDSTLLVHAPMAKDAYLVKLFAPIFGLSFRETLGFEAGGGSPGQICGQTAYVIARSAGGGIPDRQPVVAVRALTPHEAKHLLASRGTSTTHKHPPDASPTT
jgi:hypothetical protein